MLKIQTRIILEILGRPKEHVSEALKSLIERLSKENGVTILDKIIHDAVKVKDSKDLYTSFAEITLQLDSVLHYFGVMFAYMPSNIEVIYPEKITLNNIDFNELSARLVQRLHDYDAIAKRLVMEKSILENRIKESAPHLLTQQSSNTDNSKSKKKNKNKKSSRKK